MSATRSAVELEPRGLFPAGASAPAPASAPFASTVVAVPIRLTGAVGVQLVDVQISYDDPGLLQPGPRFGSVRAYGNCDEVPSTSETVEALNPTWTAAGNPLIPASAWRRHE